MSTFKVTIEIGDPSATTFRSVEALVYTGASYTTLPRSFLQTLGVQPDSRRTFTIATGASIVREIGQTWARLDGQTRMTIVVFSDEGALPLIGAVTLEEFGLGVDPVARKLIPVPGLLVRIEVPGP